MSRRALISILCILFLIGVFILAIRRTTFSGDESIARGQMAGEINRVSRIAEHGSSHLTSVNMAGVPGRLVTVRQANGVQNISVVVSPPNPPIPTPTPKKVKKPEEMPPPQKEKHERPPDVCFAFADMDGIVHIGIINGGTGAIKFSTILDTNGDEPLFYPLGPQIASTLSELYVAMTGVEPGYGGFITRHVWCLSKKDGSVTWHTRNVVDTDGGVDFIEANDKFAVVAYSYYVDSESKYHAYLSILTKDGQGTPQDLGKVLNKFLAVSNESVCLITGPSNSGAPNLLTCYKKINDILVSQWAKSAVGATSLSASDRYVALCISKNPPLYTAGAVLTLYSQEGVFKDSKDISDYTYRLSNTDRYLVYGNRFPSSSTGEIGTISTAQLIYGWNIGLSYSNIQNLRASEKLVYSNHTESVAVATIVRCYLKSNGALKWQTDVSQGIAVSHRIDMKLSPKNPLTY